MDAYTDGFAGSSGVIGETGKQGATVTTNYTYDVFNHLTGVSMPRGGNTQTRTFMWCNTTPAPNHTCQQDTGFSTGANMVRATNPESGMVAYTYNIDHTVASRTDAKGQITYYQYDNYGRLSGRTYYVAPSSKTFNLDYSYWGDGSDLTGAWFKISNSVNDGPANSCYGYLDVLAWQVYLMNNAGTGFSATLQNSQCSVSPNFY